MKDDQFLWLVPDDLSSNRFINLNHIVRAEIDEQGRVALFLSNNTTINIEGRGRLDILKFVMKHSVLPSGDKPPQEMLQQIFETIDKGVTS